jgi:recombinational DNA repair protein RecR
MKKKAKRKPAKKARKERPKRTTIASKLADMRKKVLHDCLQCGKRFSGIKVAKFCSDSCRQKAKYQRKIAAAKKEVQPETPL